MNKTTKFMAKSVGAAALLLGASGCVMEVTPQEVPVAIQESAPAANRTYLQPQQAPQAYSYPAPRLYVYQTYVAPIAPVIIAPRCGPYFIGGYCGPVFIRGGYGPGYVHLRRR